MYNNHCQNIVKSLEDIYADPILFNVVLRRGLMVSNPVLLDQLRLNSEFDTHWEPYTDLTQTAQWIGNWFVTSNISKTKLV